MAIVLDVSIVATWFLGDEGSGSAEALLERVIDEGAYVPALFRWEIQNVLLGAERAGRIASDDVDAALESLRDLPIRIEAPGDRVFAGAEFRLARYYDLTPYDAAYLALAADRRLSLATTDHALAHAARDLGIAVLPDSRQI